MTTSGAVNPQMAENYPWQLRARAVGLTQRILSRLTGHTETTVSRQLRGHWDSGVPEHIKGFVEAWEIMDANQRERWLRAVEDRRKIDD